MLSFSVLCLAAVGICVPEARPAGSQLWLRAPSARPRQEAFLVYLGKFEHGLDA